MTRTAAIHPPRPTCDARQHDTSWAFRRWHCRCPDAINAERQVRSRYAPKPKVSGERPPGRPKAGAVVNPQKVAVAVSGVPVDLNPLELAEALAAYDVNGRSAAAVARRLGCCERTVQRHRAQRRALGAVA